MTERALLLNPDSGGVAASIDELRYSAAQYDCGWYEVRDPNELDAILERIRNDGCRRLIIGGGDGTVSRVINHLSADWSQFELAVIPLGTGNDLARSLKIPVNDVDLAMKMACEGEAKWIDVVSLQRETSRFFVNAACGGFGGELARDITPADKQLWGAFSYWMTAISKLMTMTTYEATIEIDGVVRQQNVYGVTIANGRFVGGGFPIAANARLNDGKFDVVIIPAMPALELLGVGMDLMIDVWYVPEQVEVVRARKVRVQSQPEMLFSVDGEPRRTIDVTFEIVPNAIRIVGDLAESHR